MAILARDAATRLGLVADLEARGCIEVVSFGGDWADVEPSFDSVDVLLIDLEDETWTDYRESLPGLGLAVIVIGAESVGIIEGLDLPGCALLSSDVGGSEITAAAEAVLHGLYVYDPSLIARSPEQEPADSVLMTQREIEILELLADGLANKQIALRLDISIHTVKFHVAAILGKLGAASRTEAVTMGMRSGIIRL
jgi:DNA-binding NarL/FixJ family response regulator